MRVLLLLTSIYLVECCLKREPDSRAPLQHVHQPVHNDSSRDFSSQYSYPPFSPLKHPTSWPSQGNGQRWIHGQEVYGTALMAPGVRGCRFALPSHGSDSLKSLQHASVNASLGSFETISLIPHMYASHIRMLR